MYRLYVKNEQLLLDPTKQVDRYFGEALRSPALQGCIGLSMACSCPLLVAEGSDETSWKSSFLPAPVFGPLPRFPVYNSGPGLVGALRVLL
jgi:hypothetical protein